MTVSIFFLVGSLFFIYYGIKLKNAKQRDIKHPILIGFLFFLFAIFNHFDFVIGRLIVGIPTLLLIIGEFLINKKSKKMS